MSTLDLQVKFISPTFLTGADPQSPEVRAPSVRGQLRYWLRALLGARTEHLQTLWEQESAVFGSTGTGSRVLVRVLPADDPPVVRKEPLLPHREGTRENVSLARAIEAGHSFGLQLATRPGIALPEEALAALRLWALLGGIGKRSRRMMGAIQVTSKDAGLTRPKDAAELAAQVRQALAPLASGDEKRCNTSVPAFPVLHPKRSWIIVGTQPFESPKEANQDLFRSLLRTPTFRSDTFGFVNGRRRASPLIAQVRKIGNQYYPVLTAFYSEPGERIDWGLLSRFMRAAQDHYAGMHIWGGW